MKGTLQEEQRGGSDRLVMIKKTSGSCYKKGICSLEYIKRIIVLYIRSIAIQTLLNIIHYISPGFPGLANHRKKKKIRQHDLASLPIPPPYTINN